MRVLTKGEEQIMHILWELKKGFVKEILAKFPDPKPAYNTVSTIVRILEQKGFVDHTAYGKTHEYFPVVSKKEYTRSFMKKFVRNYFKGSYMEMVSFFAREDKLSVSELDELIREVKKDMESPEDQKRD